MTLQIQTFKGRRVNTVNIWHTHHLLACRLYIEQYSADASEHDQDAQAALAEIIKIALDISQLASFTGREKPTVIT